MASKPAAKGPCLSNRAHRYLTLPTPLSAYFARWSANRYNKVTNTQGIINLGTSENKILEDLIVPKVNEGLAVIEEHAHYFSFRGIPRFRKSVANFLDHYMKPVEKINPDHIIAFNGCGSAVLRLGTVLCDPGEGMIILAPYYAGFDVDLYLEPEVVCIPAPLTSKVVSSNNVKFEITLDVLEQALQKAEEQNVTVRALLLNTPHNPLGTVFSEDEIRLCMTFCQKHSLHLISDEIYMLSIFKEGVSMKSALAMEPGLIDPELLHVIWGFSKDFGLSGIRAGVVYSRNTELRAAVNVMGYFQTIPLVLQDALANLLNDLEWLDNTLIPTNHKRLRECYALVCNTLQDLGVPFVAGDAGLYVWADLRQYIHPLDFETEEKFTETLIDHGVYINCGSSFHSNEPGWFRIVFSSDLEIIRVGMERIGKFLKSLKNN